MTGEERNEIRRLPRKYRPLGAWGYFWYSVLFAIPLIGWIALIICAISSSNINRRSYARSIFCVLIIMIVLLAIAAVLAFTVFPQYGEMVKDLFSQIMSKIPV